jgi:hypothetical protein
MAPDRWGKWDCFPTLGSFPFYLYSLFFPCLLRPSNSTRTSPLHAPPLDAQLVPAKCELRIEGLKGGARPCALFKSRKVGCGRREPRKRIPPLGRLGGLLIVTLLLKRTIYPEPEEDHPITYLVLSSSFDLVSRGWRQALE